MWKWLSYMEYSRKERKYTWIAPKGMVHQEDKCLLLEKMIYVLVQSARAYYKKFTAVLLEERFTQSAADPCLYA
jgi:hypothetical protein